MSDHHGLAERLATPFKAPSLVLRPSYQPGQYDSHAIDVPFLFRHDERTFMLHVGYDGIGYRTGLAVSDDMRRWDKLGLIVDRGPAGSPTEFNAAMTWIVRDNTLDGPSTLTQVQGRFLGTYHCYPRPGYEAGPASIGLCWSEDLLEWELEPPFFHANDGADWERGGLYKSCMVQHEGAFYIFYNAKNRDPGPWYEQTGVAISTDLRRWERYGGNPVLPVGPEGTWDDIFASDPCVLRWGDIWVMFYYGLCSRGGARDGLAWSDDLLHWHKLPDPILDVGPEGSYDARYAHKPAILMLDGVLYHAYCGVKGSDFPRQQGIAYDEERGIAIAASRPWR